MDANYAISFFSFEGNGFIGLTVDGDNTKLFILNNTNINVVEIPFSNLLQFHPMGESPDKDGKVPVHIVLSVSFSVLRRV